MKSTAGAGLSLICTALFCGCGFGLIGRLDRTALYAVMLFGWLAQLVSCPAHSGSPDPASGRPSGLADPGVWLLSAASQST